MDKYDFYFQDKLQSKLSELKFTVHPLKEKVIKNNTLTLKP